VEMSDDEILMIGGASMLLLHFATKKKRLSNSEHLATLDPAVQTKFKGFISELQQKGLEPIINSSTRSLLKQAVLKIKDPRNASPGKSKHSRQIRKAVDLQVKFKGKYLGKKDPKAVWISSGVPQIASRYGLKWGGDIKGYYDPVHYEAV